MPKDNELRWILALLAAVVVLQAVVLWPMLSSGAVMESDITSHLTLIEGMAQAQNPLDFWSPEIGFGSPVGRTYQPLAHLMVVALHFACGKAVSLVTILTWCRYLAIVLLPLSMFYFVRALGFSPLTGAAAALLLPFVAGPRYGEYGMDLRSWLRFGIYPQSVATHLLLITMGLGFQAVRRGTRLALTGTMLGLTCLTHFVYGWIGALSLCLMALMPDTEAPRRARIRRTAAIGAVALVLTAFQIWPLITDGPIINRSPNAPAGKFDSYGAQLVLEFLFTGQMMDHDRIPTLSLLAFGGGVVLIWRWRKQRKLPAHEKFALLGALVWILILFGRPTWGMLMLLLGATLDVHLHRVIAVVQIFLLLLAASGLAGLWRWIGRRWAPGVVVLTGLVLVPPVMERIEILEPHMKSISETLAAVQADGPDLERAIASVRQRRGRVYAGIGNNWGASFKLGDSTVYSFLATHQVPAVGYPYYDTALPSDLMAWFDEAHPDDYRLFNVHSAIAPNVPGAVPFLTPLADYGRFRVYDAPGTGYISTSWTQPR